MGAVSKFHCTNSELITVSELIISNAEDNKTNIVAKRPKMADPYFPDQNTRVLAAKDKYIGLDSAKNMRTATTVLNSIMKTAKDDLSEFNTDLAVDYKKDKTKLNEILNTLGFNKYYNSVTHNNQKGTLDLFAQFKKNLTAELEADIIDKGMSTDLITRIKGYADSLDNANLTQESAKGKRPEITDEAVTELNEIYHEIIAMCIVCQKIFKDDDAKKNLFVFSKVLASLRGGNHGGNGGDDTPPTPPPAQ
ncbi:MAG: hypothetical protein M1480_14805 [Bacteroidetes bacterium]|nr:hypothetical protein [Bacteroidota bacterium]